MCRSRAQGGRRCPCSGGDYRRAYQRELYARKKLGREYGAVAGGRLPDLLVTSQAVADVKAIEHWNWRERAAYTTAVIAHGAAVRAHATRAVEDKWNRAMCADEHLADAETTLTAATLAAKGTPYNSPEREVAVAEYQQVKAICDQRRALYVETMRETLGASRELGGDLGAMLDEEVPVTRADRALLETVAGKLPAGMLDDLLTRKPPDVFFGQHTGRLTLTRRGIQKGTGGHFSAAAPRTRRVEEGMLADPAYLVNGRGAGTTTWKTPVDGVQDWTDLEGRGCGKYLREDTPENRETLQAQIDDAVMRHPDLQKRGKKPRIVAADGKLGVMLPRRRYDDLAGGNQYRIAHDGTESTLAHEIGHMLEEGNPDISTACMEFLGRRTQGLEPETAPAVPGGRGAYEFTGDHFVTPYVGRHYEEGGDEVFSIGLEVVLTGSRGGLIGLETAVAETEGGSVRRTYRADPEHLDLMLGLLTTANQRQPAEAESTV